MSAIDPYNLQRFISAQETYYSLALSELRAGHKDSHWIWYIFPQITRLGHSPESQLYSIQDRSEAVAYLNHDILGRRLHECCSALLELTDKRIEDIMGMTDSMKLRSSMTLFNFSSSSSPIFQQVLDRYFSGHSDTRTIQILNQLDSL